MEEEELAGSTLRGTVEKRGDVLFSIRESPARKPTLNDRLDVSRSTVDRAIDSLVEAGLVRRVDGEYRVTPYGRLTLDAYREYVDSTDALTEAGPLLDGLPPDATVPRSLFENGRISIAEPHAPESAITEAIEELQTSDRLLVASPIVMSSYVRPVHAEVVGDELAVDLVLEGGVVDSFVSLSDVTGTIGDLVDADPFSLYRTEATLPFMLYLMLGGPSDVVGVTVHDGGGIVGSVTTDEPTAVAWGREWFDDVMAAAEQVPKSSLEL